MTYKSVFWRIWGGFYGFWGVLEDDEILCFFAVGLSGPRNRKNRGRGENGAGRQRPKSAQGTPGCDFWSGRGEGGLPDIGDIGDFG